MKPITTFLTILFISFLSSPSWSETLTMDDLVERDGLFYKKFTNTPFTGDVASTESGNFINGKRIGEWLTFHENGQLEEIGNFEDGNKDGSWTTYHVNGQLRSKGNYKYDKMDGFWEFYYKNGQLSNKGNYDNGEREDGHWEFYYDNGQLWSRGNYKDGKMDGFWYSYNEDGLVDKWTGVYRKDVKQY